MARDTIKAAEKVASFLKPRQQKREIRIRGKKVSLVAIPSAQANPVRGSMAGIAIVRRWVVSVTLAPIPKTISNWRPSDDGATNKEQQQTAAMENGTTIKSDPNTTPI